MATTDRISYASEYVMHCLKKHIYIRSEIVRMCRNLCGEREDLMKDIGAPSSAYREKVSTLDPVYNMYKCLENTRREWIFNVTVWTRMKKS